MKIDDIECSPVELAIYAASFVQLAANNGSIMNAPEDAKRAGIYEDGPGRPGCRTRADWAKGNAENAVRWHREVAS